MIVSSDTEQNYCQIPTGYHATSAKCQWKETSFTWIMVSTPPPQQTQIHQFLYLVLPRQKLIDQLYSRPIDNNVIGCHPRQCPVTNHPFTEALIPFHLPWLEEAN
uniref:Uncharacterized protein n=1 Tax=Nelumbo nucifera TaxID=4432 RepID=A0A822Y130_NELNU|nr:TPA_asm: hypothetical protein HUJ06_026239 [Nelumbo nucifera]